MIKIAVCDDDGIYRAHLMSLVQKVTLQDKVDIVDFDSGEALLASIQMGGCYDIVFLDVQLKGLNGNEVGKLVRQQDSSVLIVYCSGIQLTVPPSLIRESSPYSYLLKTAGDDKLIEEIKLVYTACCEQQRLGERFLFLDCSDRGRGKFYLNKIFYFANQKRTIKRKVLIKYMDFMDEPEPVYVEETLPELYKQIAAYGFAYSHNSFLINLSHVHKVSKKDMTVILDNREKILLSRSKVDNFIDKFSEFARRERGQNVRMEMVDIRYGDLRV